ncbi:benzoate/H(+) symporter BenE family transporter [Candidatus Vallotia cooleyia]|uniref:benzoate/H(+) symporter BenE family transporter n=1 Tax=Candidatus Vallotiella adelgis TaxID=1177211 RepID=UPI001D00B498|nr:benzoate/H(+) symporter BenE family transporter [Candidatus Vallotia cooleyia]
MTIHTLCDAHEHPVKRYNISALCAVYLLTRIFGETIMALFDSKITGLRPMEYSLLGNVKQLSELYTNHLSRIRVAVD